jgi:hypothetical protein
MRSPALSIVLSLTSAFVLAAGCGSTDEDPDPGATAGGTAGAGGSSGGSAGTSGNSGGSGGSLPTGPTGCEDERPETGEPCSDRNLVCPSLLGSCVCRGEQDLEWTCYEVGGEPDGSGGASQGEGGQGPVGTGGSGDAGGQPGSGGDGGAPPEGGSDAGGQAGNDG